MMSRNKIKTLYLHFHQTYKHKFDTVVTKVKGFDLTKSHTRFIMWSRNVT